jgi:polar amino acid transport system substrate-binding protein
LKRKLALILLLCFSLTLVLAGCSSQAPEEPGEDTQTPAVEDTSWQDIQDKGHFVVGLDDAFPPMGFREKGTNDIVGFDIDLAKEVAQRMGVEVQFQPVIWDTIIEELNGGNVDVIWNGLTITEERKAKIAFTKPYIEDKQIIVVQKGSPIANKKDLAGKTIGIQNASSAVKAVKAEPEIYESFKDMVEFTSNDEALLDLSAGRLDAVVVDEVVGKWYISKKPDTYQILEDNFGKEQFGVGVRQTDKAFLQELDKALDAMKADGTAAEISQKWFGENITI